MSQSTSQSTTQKHTAFVGAPMTNQPVTAIPGIGKVLGNRLNENGYPDAPAVYGQYLKDGKDPVTFKADMKADCGANSKQQSDCHGAMKEWGDQHFH
ncbi:barrier-to-autointegration factor-like [Littorina saxatilis]|uniref:Barrier-to-autointegration factor n=1 Tax=Littorina saxatilis TaxID=31220 RepID=A0AAN9BHF9_9CAEN